MKTKILLLFILLNLFQNPTAKAQWVTIPDANFVAYLQQNFPSCMNGNQMDTTCNAITSVTYLYISSQSTDLTGIQYFDSLDSLNCSGGHSLAFIPSLPTGLTYLNCWEDNFTTLPPLSGGLTYLDCGDNVLTSLPPLPNSLQTIRCERNQLTSLPTLPSMLSYLNCGSNQLTSLPAFPNSLLSIDCYNNQLTSLPTLNNTIQYIYCTDNLLTSLPTLPSSLTSLYCDANQLTTIPTVPNSLHSLYCQNNQINSLPALIGCTNLSHLYCQNNQLTSLPTLPTTSNFSDLNCSYNLLTSLPALPYYLHSLVCNNNNITCLPVIPPYIGDSTSLAIYNNPITCLPNYTVHMPPYLLAYPLCISGDLINNPNNCTNAQGITGYNFHDNNGDCIFNSSDSSQSNVSIKLYDSGNNLISQTYSAANGVYDFPEVAGTYTVKVDTTGVPFTAQCSYPGIDSTLTLSTAFPLATNVNFDYACKPGFDVGVQSVHKNGIAFPGEEHSLHIVAGDLSNWYNLHCAAGISGQVVITVTGPVIYDSIVSGSLTPAIGGNVFTYNIADFGTLNNFTSFGLNFSTDTASSIGDTVCVNISVTPVIGDNNIFNNNYSYCYIVDSSYDPNFKEVYPINVPVNFNDYFTYTIHFQNIGSSPAINIHLRDTLDANLDLNSFEVINYSHSNTIWLTGNKLSVYYTNINLPDSATNFNGSQGFIQYRIKPKPIHPSGTQIHNRASIYFDYNAPVVTNTTVNLFTSSLGVGQTNQQSTIDVYPNPAKNELIIRTTNNQQLSTIKIYNVLGECVYQSDPPAGGPKSEMSVDISQLAKGVYILQLTTGNQQLITKKVVKE